MTNPTADSDAMIVIRNVDKHFGHVRAVNNVSLDIKPWAGGGYHRPQWFRQINAAALH